jgi:1-acyl-sn-glycerol-3-phosphate acyltransferase
VDGALVTASFSSPVSVSGLENLPQRLPCVIVANHLNGPGVWVGLPAAVVAGELGKAVADVPVRGVGVAAYDDFRIGKIVIPNQLTSFVFQRFYRVYDVIRMPRASEPAISRTAAVRRILAALRSGHTILLFPEGQNVDNFVMRRLRPGTGTLLQLAARLGYSVIPCGVSPTGGSFAVQFGAPIEGSSSDAGDLEEAVGHAIAQLVPPRYRGAYAEKQPNEPASSLANSQRSAGPQAAG